MKTYPLLIVSLFNSLLFFGQEINIPGNTDFNSKDRIAINDVIDAYGFYWDSNDLESFLSLFSDDAIGVTINARNERDKYLIKSVNQVNDYKKRMEYFEKHQMQRRHMMANTLFISMDSNYAHIKKYMTLMTTNKKEKTEIVTPISYVFKLEKINSIWKIVYREINLDKQIDLPLIK